MDPETEAKYRAAVEARKDREKARQLGAEQEALALKTQAVQEARAAFLARVDASGGVVESCEVPVVALRKGDPIVMNESLHVVDYIQGCSTGKHGSSKFLLRTHGTKLWRPYEYMFGRHFCPGEAVCMLDDNIRAGKL